jgi:hypothetical protein
MPVIVEWTPGAWQKFNSLDLLPQSQYQTLPVEIETWIDTHYGQLPGDQRFWSAPYQYVVVRVRPAGQQGGQPLAQIYDCYTSAPD